MTITERLRQLELTLPDPAAAVATYKPYHIHENILFISGQVSLYDGVLIKGRLGEELDVASGQAAARACALNIMAQAQKALGSLEHVAQILKLNIFVASTTDFTDQPLVGNGASDLFVEVFGDKGRHTRSAVGVAVLPLGVAVEIDAQIAITD